MVRSRRSVRIATLPPTSVLDIEEMDRLVEELQELMSAQAPHLQISGLDCTSAFLEQAERNHQRLIGIPFSASSIFNQRSAFVVPRTSFTVGRLTSILESKGVSRMLKMQLIDPPTVDRAVKAAALRLLLACFTLCGCKAPLTDDAFVEGLRQQAFEPMPQGCPENSRLAEESIRAHSAGLLAIALTQTGHCEETVRSGFIGPLLTYLTAEISELDSSVALKLPSSRQQLFHGQQSGSPQPPPRTLEDVTQSPIRRAAALELPESPAEGDQEMQTAESPLDDSSSPDGGIIGPSSMQAPRRSFRALEKEEACSSRGEMQNPSQTIQPGITQQLPLIQAEADRELSEIEDFEMESPALQNQLHPEHAAAAALLSFSRDVDEVMVTETQRAQTPLNLSDIQSRRLHFSVQCAISLGAYLEFLPSILASGGVRLVMRLLEAWRDDRMKLHDALQWLASLLAHRKFADGLLEEGGLELLLKLPRSVGIRTSLAIVFACLALIPSALQKLAAFPEATVEEFVRTVLEPLRGSEDPARKSASVLLVNTLAQPVILKAFNDLRGADYVVGALATSFLVLRNGSGGFGVRQEKQIAFPLCQALSLYFRAHFVLRVNDLRGQQPFQTLIPVDVETLDAAFEALVSNAELARKFQNSRWEPAATFDKNRGLALLFSILQAPASERYFTDMAVSALEILAILSLVPNYRRALLRAETRQKNPIETLLSTAGLTSTSDPEVKAVALRVIVNLIGAPKTGGESGSAASSSKGFPLFSFPEEPEKKVVEIDPTVLEARKMLRAANGLRSLLALLQARTVSGNSWAKLRTLAARGLSQLAQDPNTCHTLSTLQISKKLAELLTEHSRSSISEDPRTDRSGGLWRRAFVEAAMDLISLTTPGMQQTSPSAAADITAPALFKMERTAIAASSSVSYKPRELLGLIKDHLLAAGLQKSADALQLEAGLGEEQPDSLAFSAEGETPRSFPGPSGTTRKQISFAASLRESWGASPPHSCLTKLRRPQAPSRSNSLPIATCLVSEQQEQTPQKEVLSDAEVTPSAFGGHSSPSVRDSFEASKVQNAPLRAQLQSAGACASEPVVGEGSAHSFKRQIPEQLPLQLHPHLRKGRALVPYASHTFGQSKAQAVTNHLENLPQRKQRLSEQGLEALALLKTPQIASLAFEKGLGRPVDDTCITSDDSEAGSRLSTIVLQYLHQQHRAACLSAHQPISTLPPLSLTGFNVLPQAKHELHASKSATRRVLDRQVVEFGGSQGRQKARHFVYSRFRHRKSIRNSDDGSVQRACSFLEAGEKLVVGTESGMVRVHNSFSGEVIEENEAHPHPIIKLQVYDACNRSWILSSARSEVKLWEAGKTDRDPVLHLPCARRGVFSPDGQYVAVHSTTDCMATIVQIEPESEAVQLVDTDKTSKHPKDVCYSPSGELLLLGSSLWDPRTPRQIHRFDAFAEGAFSSTFHPRGLEAIINSEVWDLRTFRLRRSAAHLNNTSLVFNSTGSIAYACLRRSAEDLSAIQQPRWSRHPLHAAFRVVDANDYSEIATIGADGRCVLDLAADPLENSLALITVEAEGSSSSARLYDIGKKRNEGDESDYEACEGSEDEGSDNSEDEDPDVDEPAMLRSEAGEEPRREMAAEQESEAADEGEEEEAAETGNEAVEEMSQQDEEAGDFEGSEDLTSSETDSESPMDLDDIEAQADDAAVAEGFPAAAETEGAESDDPTENWSDPSGSSRTYDSSETPASIAASGARDTTEWSESEWDTISSSQEPSCGSLESTSDDEDSD